ncbi:NAD(P)-bd-dom domain-containing protein [Fusarium falciforme]|uniref:NAD(P)-bd-dom domain-containing protein n=1 Tax=Fusarium falciforme TaxID=195108 RepID=UPI002300275C|nr:NAD(P)-bd-dom domain-containing protein [Fusarium falciforme]WAO96613.1 NAD(P)-bd-dom domain-containing protein [Fusarium falciforme]
MTLRITVLPASSKAGKETIRNLLESDAKPLIHGIYRDLSKVPAELANHERFEATQGDVGAGTGLDFSRSDALFYVPPPTYDEVDQGEWGVKTATNVKEALGKAPNVKKLLLFSSMGAQYDHGIGLLRLNHISDKILKDSVPEAVIVKPGYFQENWSHAFETIQAEPPVIYSTITPLDHKIPMVSIRDIGRACADALLAAPKDVSPYYFDLYGPRHYSALDVKEAVEQITGKKVELVPIEKDNLAEFYAREIPSAQIQDFVEMTTSALPGGIMAGDFGSNERTVQGKVELVEALRPLYTQ